MSFFGFPDFDFSALAVFTGVDLATGSFVAARGPDGGHHYAGGLGWRLGDPGSSHDLGGCRMGDDPAESVLDADLAVHDTPGLYVFGGAAFPSCPGINPTLTIWALCLRAAERLVERLASS